MTRRCSIADNRPMTHGELLGYYAEPGIFTTVGGFEEQIAAVPDDIAAIVGVVQGLLIHEAFAQAYGVKLSEEQRAQKQLHGAEAMLSCAMQADSRPMGEPRPPNRRVAVVCRHLATLFVAILRQKGVPARARCGFANYFDKTKHTDHWVGEYWDAGAKRWVLVDAQVDQAQRGFFKVDVDTLDVPRDRFLVAGDAWRLCRSGSADPATFGVAGTENWGLIEVFGNVFQDLAALQKIELLPWGWYGLAKDVEHRDGEAALVDALASLTSAADAGSMKQLLAMVEGDRRLRVPPETLDAILEADRTATTAGA